MAPDELTDLVSSAGRTRHHCLVVQKPAQVSGEFRGRAIASLAIAIERLHRDPVQIPPQLTDQLFRFSAACAGGRARGVFIAAHLRAGVGRLFLSQLTQPLLERWLLASPSLERL